MKPIIHNIVLLVAGLLLAVYLASGQETKKVEPVKPPSETEQLKKALGDKTLLAAYEKVILVQNSLNQAAAEFNQIAEQERKARNLPEGTRFDIHVDTGAVLVVEPPAKEPDKAKEKPAEKK